MFDFIFGHYHKEPFEVDKGIINDGIPRCLTCGMITGVLRTDIDTNLRIWCKDCKVVWLLPSNYFQKTLNSGGITDA